MKTRKRPGRPEAEPAAKRPAPGRTRASSKEVESPKKPVVTKLPPGRPRTSKGAVTLVVKTSSPAKGKGIKEVGLPYTRMTAPPVKKPINYSSVIKITKIKGKSSAGTPTSGPAEKKESKTAEPAEEREDEHNYSKDPKDELMKLNLPVYACSLCKRYTFDPQQSSYHARTAHNGKVGIMLMLPLQNVEIPKLVPPKKQKQMPGPPPQSTVTSALPELKKMMYECEKCDRHFERMRQMNMHKCLEQSRRKSSPRRGEEGKAPKSPRRAPEVTRPKSPRLGEAEKMMVSEIPSSPADMVIAQNEETMSDDMDENGAEEKMNPAAEIQVVHVDVNNEQLKTGDKLKKVGDSEKTPIEVDDSDDSDEDGIPPTLGVHLDKSLPLMDRRGTWKLAKKKDVTGWKWEAQKVPDNEVKQKAEEEAKQKAEEEKEVSEPPKVHDPIVIPDTVLGDDEDDYDFGEDDYAEDDDDDEPIPVANSVNKPGSIGNDEANSELQKYKILSAELEDDMVKQWADKKPPTAEEINKYIRIVNGGLQSGTGQALEFFMCLICRKVFKTKNVMRPHIYCHIGYRPYVCGQCGFSATHHAAWKVHVQKHTDNELKCWHGQCAYIGKIKEDLDEHRKTHAPALCCMLCNVKFKGQSTILGHLYISHQEEIKEGIGKEFYTKMATAGRSRSQIVLFECDICGQKCKTKRGYYAHIRMNHAPNSSPEKGSKKGEGVKVLNRRKRKRGNYAKKPTRILKCPMCGFICHTDNNLKRHLNSHPFIYRCCMCEDRFLTYGALNEHVGFHRAEEEGEFNPQEKINESLRKSIYLGTQMDKALEADKVQWAQRRTGAAAPKSAMTGTIFDELMSKISIPTENVSKEELQQLGDIFAEINYKRLTPSILRYIHLRFGNVECGVCGKLFPKVGLCKDHTKKHTKAKDFKCTKCDFQGTTKKGLERHLARVHNEGESFHCPDCDTNIIGGDMYKHHMRRHAKENAGPYTCTWCNTVEEKKEDMKNHIMNTHPMMPLAESTKIMGSGVVVHREKGAPFLVCEVCNETFRRICDLRRHMWKHSTVKRFTCDLCDYGSDKRGNIISHMRRHSTEKEATCHVCGKMYKTMQSLKLHVRSAHLKLKPFKCDLCDYAAAQPVHLRRHAVLHHTGGERRKFRCGICPDYKATDLQVVKRHYKKKHPKEKMNISKCCPPEAQNPSMSKKDKHQVIQVVPSLPAQTETPAIQEIPAPTEVTHAMDQEQLNQSADMDSAIVEVQTEQHPQITNDMTVEVVLPEDQAQLIDINSALPDVINALAALQESEFNTQ